MSLGARMPNKEARLTIWFTLFAAPIVVGYASMTWTLVQYIARAGSWVLESLTAASG